MADIKSYAEAITAIGGLVSAGSSMYSGYLGVESAKYSSQMLDYQAEYQDVLTRIEESRIRRELRQIIGSQRARTAAAGIMPDVGTPLELQVESEILAEIDIALLRISGGMKKMQLSAEASAAEVAGWEGFSKKFGQASATMLETASMLAERKGTGPYSGLLKKRGTEGFPPAATTTRRWSPRVDTPKPIKTKWSAR